MEQVVYREYPGEMSPLWKKILDGYPDDLKLAWYEKLFKTHLIYSQLISAHQVVPRGLVYLGANAGQLLWTWVLMDFPKILMVEPQPHKFQVLQKNTKVARTILETCNHFTGPGSIPQLHTEQCAVGHEEGTVPLYVMSNSNLTSLLEPNLSLLEEQTKHILSEVKVSQKIDVPMVTLDNLITRNPEYSLSEFNFLYMNIQGSELNALKGGHHLLENLEFILLEVNYTDRYFDCPSEDTIQNYLTDYGFKPVWGHKSPESGFLAFAKK